MKIIKKLKLIGQFFSWVIGVVGGVATIYFLFIHKDIVNIEIKTIDKVQLTNTANEKDLTVKYLYQDSVEINNLWKIRCVVSNTGTKAIIAKGENKNILNEYLSIAVKDSIKILSFNVNANFTVEARLDTKNNILLDFKQWKESEYLDIVVLVENQGKTNPYIFIDERDIVDAKVGSSEYNPDDIMKSKKIINYLPEWLSYFLQGMFLAVIIIVNVAIIIAINKQLKSNTDTIKYANRVTVVIGLISVLISAIPILWMF